MPQSHVRDNRPTLVRCVSPVDYVSIDMSPFRDP